MVSIEKTHCFTFFSDSFVPQGYVTFVSDGTYPADTGQIRFRDVTSPINPEDHTLDSSGGKGNIDTLTY